MRLVSYSKYKEADVCWIGSIPAHWEEMRAKYYFKEIDERSITGKEEMLSVSHITGVTPRSQKKVSMFKAESNIGQKCCEPGDLVINTMWAWMSALGVSNHSGIVSPSYGVYRLLNPERYDRYYLDKLLRTEGYRAQYVCLSTGVRSSRLRLYPDKFLNIKLICPPIDEQKVISRFLKVKECLFRKFIRNKRQLIALLIERKQNIVHHYVTRGINPGANYKSSGIDWIGNIPAHWEVRRLKFLADIKTGGRDTVDRNDAGEFPFFVRSQTVERINSYSFDGEAVLTAGDGAGVAKVFHYVNGKFDYHQRVYKFSNFRGVIGKYFYHYLSNTLRFEAFRETAKSTVDSLRLPMLQNFPVLLLPLSEQEDIVSFIEKETGVIDKAITRAEREIALIREYLNRLVFDVVTGKTDVSNIVIQDISEEDFNRLDEELSEENEDIEVEENLDETD